MGMPGILYQAAGHPLPGAVDPAATGHAANDAQAATGHAAGAQLTLSLLPKRKFGLHKLQRGAGDTDQPHRPDKLFKKWDWYCPNCGNHNYAKREVCNSSWCYARREDQQFLSA